MINLTQLRTVLQTALGSNLGTYTFTTGETTPAIATLIGKNNYPPPGTKPTGVECVIIADLGVGINNLMGGGYQRTYRADIALKQWDSDDDALDVVTLLEPLLDAIGEQMPELNVLPNSVRGLAAERNLNNLELVQFSVSQIEQSY